MAHSILTDLDLNSVSKILNMPDPTSAQDAATKAYVDSAVEGLAWKDSCRVSTQANIDLSSPGSTIDGITMVSGDRVLVRSQTSGAENGIYIFNGSSTPLTRSLDANTAAELEQAVTTVEEGTSASTSYRQSIVNATLGTTSLTWNVFGTVSPAASESTAGIAEIATQTETNTGTDDARFVTPAKLANYSGLIRKFSQDIGDGSSTSYTVTHNLATRDCNVTVYRNSGNYDTVLAEVRRTSTNAVAIVFSSAPTTNQFRVVVIA